MLVLVALCGAAAAEEHVLTLTGDNFSAAVADNPWMVVEFYAPWVGVPMPARAPSVTCY